MGRWRGRARGVAVAVAHGLCSGSLNILLKFLLARYHFAFLTLLQCLSSAAAALGLEALRRRGLAALPPFGPRLARPFAAVAALATLQSTLTLWSLRGLSLPMYVVFKRCLPLVTLLTGALVLRDGMPSPGVLVAVLITTCGAALAGECPALPGLHGGHRGGEGSRGRLGNPRGHSTEGRGLGAGTQHAGARGCRPREEAGWVGLGEGGLRKMLRRFGDPQNREGNLSGGEHAQPWDLHDKSRELGSVCCRPFPKPPSSPTESGLSFHLRATTVLLPPCDSARSW